ncbi:hypothetical protein PybrP1_009013 [[Pythium] brassicae (nom. inval.)]|nr:hypothetical protein PybrP1_009013 [[Pythium] brassicae (nom. inval.)]
MGGCTLCAGQLVGRRGARAGVGGAKPHGLGLGAIVGICVGAIAVVLMVAAFTIWYRRFKRATEYEKGSPRRRRNGSATGTDDPSTGFSSAQTSRLGTGDSFPMAHAQAGLWNDPTIVASKIPLEKVETQALVSRGGFGENVNTGTRLTDTAILQLVSMGRLRVEFSEAVPAQLRALGEACVAVDPRERPTAVETLYKLQLALKAL